MENTYEFIILTDRVTTAHRWIEDKFGWDYDYIDELADGHILLPDTDPPKTLFCLEIDDGSGPFWDIDGVCDEPEELTEFAREFACDGTRIHTPLEVKDQFLSITVENNQFNATQLSSSELYAAAEGKAEKEVADTAPDTERTKTFNVFGDSEKERLTNILDFQFNHLKMNVQSLATGLLDFRQYLRLYEDDLTKLGRTDYESTLSKLEDDLKTPAAVDELVNAIREETQRLIDTVFSVELVEETPAHVLTGAEDGGKQAVVDGVISALAAGDRKRYGDMYKGKPPYILESDDGEESFIVFPQRRQAICVSGNSEAAVAEELIKEVLDAVEPGRWCTIDFAERLVAHRNARCSAGASTLKAAKEAQKEHPKAAAAANAVHQ